VSSSTAATPDDRPAARREPNELRALAALAFEELQAFPGGIRDMHVGIAQRAFAGAGSAARPARAAVAAVSLASRAAALSACTLRRSR